MNDHCSLSLLTNVSYRSGELQTIKILQMHWRLQFKYFPRIRGQLVFQIPNPICLLCLSNVDIYSQPTMALSLTPPSRLLKPAALGAAKRSIASIKSSMVVSAQSSHSSYTTIEHRTTLEHEIKKSKFIAIAASIPDDTSARSFLAEVSDQRANHNCWAYKIGDQYRCSDDGEPSGTAGRPIYSAISTSGLDRVMVVVIRYFGGIKLGAAGLVRAYGGVASECLKNAQTCLVKPKVPLVIEVPYDLIGALYHQIHSFGVEDVQQDYDTGKEGITSISFTVDFDQVSVIEDAIKVNYSQEVVFYKDIWESL
ncbi:hypothetical protein Sjap_022185 [Stephania japonica]|uniref:Impact N-terminal domain-containing protein n=1 Tax=Stephania japonica TaxID=461633 RepID=A0AAP0HPM5_9MAGN